jgi:hypothetical protein
LYSVSLPRSIKRLAKDWYTGDNWREKFSVTFETAKSLREMIQRGNADLSHVDEIQIVNYDCRVKLPGFSRKLFKSPVCFVRNPPLTHCGSSYHRGD